VTGPTETQVIPSPVLLEALALLLATGGPFDAVTLMCFQNDVTLSPATVIGDLTVADFHGYANEVGVAFSSPFYDTDGSALVVGASHAFIATSGGPLNPQTIYGYAIGPAGLGSLSAAYKFDTGAPIAAVGDAVVVVPFIRYSGT